MNKTELIEVMSEQSGLSKDEAKIALETFMKTTTKVLQSGEKLNLNGFGSFAVYLRKSHNGRNPKTNKKIKIPAKNIVRFKAGAKLDGDMNGS